ncbi:hypothetical protein SDC9_154260 [bioreactor metagenome]|uniref:Uncharacterized protein n=1 Tax=bioreactor metagenome TaxID=1076179 RepID=A0A645EYA9_9ZZZZ
MLAGDRANPWNERTGQVNQQEHKDKEAQRNHKWGGGGNFHQKACDKGGDAYTERPGKVEGIGHLVQGSPFLTTGEPPFYLRPQQAHEGPIQGKGTVGDGQGAGKHEKQHRKGHSSNGEFHKVTRPEVHRKA